MNCKKIQYLLVDYVEEILPERKRKAVQKHLSSCDKCSEQFERTKRLREELRMVETPEPSVEDWERFQQKLISRLAQSPGIPARRVLPKLQTVGAAAAIVALLIFAFTMLTSKSSHGPIGIAKKQGEASLSGTGGAEEGSADEDIIALAGLSQEELSELSAEAALFLSDVPEEAPEAVAEEAFYDLNLYDNLEELSPDECDEMLQKLESI